MSNGKPRRRTTQDRVQRRVARTRGDLARGTPIRATKAARPPRNTGDLHSKRRRPPLPSEGRARDIAFLERAAERVKGMSSEELGGADKNELLRRIARTIKSKRLRTFSNARLARKGFRWSLMGAINEDVIACHKTTWKTIKAFAAGDVRATNRALKERGGEGLVDGKGLPIAKRTDLPDEFPAEVKRISDVWLVPPQQGTPDLKKMMLDPEAFGGKQFIDQGFASFAGRGEKRAMAVGADVEVKVPKKASEIGKQSARKAARRAAAGYQVMSVVNDQGKVVGREIVAVDRIVINTGSTTSYGVTGRARPYETFVLKGPKGRKGLKEMHWRFTLPISTRTSESIVNAMVLRVRKGKKLKNKTKTPGNR